VAFVHLSQAHLKNEAETPDAIIATIQILAENNITASHSANPDMKANIALHCLIHIFITWLFV
jgi:hypothetical protein